MNTKRIFIWAGFIVIIGLIIWGMIAAANKAERENANIGTVDSIITSDWTRGATTSPAVLIEYSDFQCPACAAYFPLMERLHDEMQDKFVFVYRHFPLTQHMNAHFAAQAAEAAGKQGKFWEMYSQLFNTQKDWEEITEIDPIYLDYAKKLGLDIEKFKLDYSSSETIKKVDDNVKSGIKAGVNSTPSFFLNGKKISPKSYDEFKQLIETASTTNS